MRYFHRLLHNCKGAVLAALCCVVFYATPATAYQWNATATVDSSTMATNTLCYWAGKVLECSATNPTIASGQVGIGTSSFSQELTVAGNIDITGTGLGFLSEIANAGSPGTTVNTLAKLNSSGAAVIAATTDTDGIVGIVSGGAGTTGNAQIAVNGQAQCVFDGATTAGDFVSISSTTAGDCHDAGSTRSTSSQTIGRVLTGGSAGTYPVELALNGSAAGSGAATGSGTLNYVARWTPNGTTLGIGKLYDTGSLVSVGTTTTASMLGVYGGLSVGTTYVSTAAPTNGMIVQGSVGIGTTTPLSKLQVAGRMTLDESGYFELMANGTYNSLYSDAYLNNGYAGRIEFNQADGGWDIETAVYGTAATSIPSYTKRMTILSTGSVGIGTTAPGALLQVGSTSGGNIDPSLSASNLGTVSFVAQNQILSMGLGGAGSSYGQWIQSHNVYGSSFPLLLNPSGGNVGIGTTNPTAKLHLYDGILQVDNTGVGQNASVSVNAASGQTADISLQRANSELWQIGLNSGGGGGTGALTFYNDANSAIQLDIEANGNVGIGTTSPSATLDIYRNSLGAPLNIRTGSGDSGANIGYTSTTNGTNTISGYWGAEAYTGQIFGGGPNDSTTPLVLFTNSTERMRVTATGNVGIGTTSPGSSLQINGNVAIGYSANTAGPTNGLAVSGAVAIGSTSVIAGAALDLSNNTTSSNSSLLLPVGTTGARPTGTNGMIRYNTALTPPAIEAYVNGGWESLQTSGATSGILGVANGGTGDSTLTQYAVLLGNGTSPIASVGPGATSGQALISQGSSANPIFGTINLASTSIVTGTLPVGNGGTNASSASGTALDNITGFAGTGFLTRTGAGAYSFQSATNGITLGNIAQIATNTVLGNATSGTANVTALAVGGCSAATNALIWTTNTGFGCNSAINAATLGGATFAAPGAIGSGTAGSGAFTTLSASGTVSGAGFTAYMASPPAIGGTAANTGAFTALSVQEPSTVNAATYTVATTDSSLIFTTTADTVTLPTASSFPGRILYMKAGTTPVAVISNASNVVPQTTAAAGTAILPATAGAYATLQSDGTNWIVMESGTSGVPTTFTSITTGTNTTATMTVGTGGMLTFSGSGTVNADQFMGNATIAAANGGTGQTTYAVGDVLYASTTSALSRLADVAAGSYLRSGGVTTAPVWSSVTLPNAATIGDIWYASTSTAMTALADAATGNVLISGGAGVAPSWGKVGLTTAVTGVLPVANGGTNASSASGTALDNITGFASTGFLTRTGAGTYAFQSATNGITLGNLAQAGAYTVLGNNTSSTANVAAITAPVVSGAMTTSQTALATTSTDGIVLTNMTASTSGAQIQYSPRVHFTGEGWHTGGTAANQTIDFIEEVQPTASSGSSSTGNLVWSNSIGGGSTSALMTLTSGGNVGIGTASPGAVLDVAGTGRFQGPGTSPTTGEGLEFRYNAGAAYQQSIKHGSGYMPYSLDGSTLLLNSSSGGDVGINTLTPQSILSVAGGVAIGTTYAGTNAAGSNNLIVQGSVGIGTTSPSDKLDVAGAIGLTTTTGTLPTNGLYSPASNNLALTTGGAENLLINSNGQVAIGSSSVNAGVALDLSNNNTAANSSLLLPLGATRPTTGINGMIRYNPSLPGVEAYVNGVWSTLQASGTTSGTLGVANGGTGDTTLTAHSVMLGEGSSAVGTAGPGAVNTVLIGNGNTTDPSFSGSPTLSGVITDLQSIGATSTDGLVLQNTTAAANNAQQYSPRLHFSGKGWETGTGASQFVDFIQELQPTQSTGSTSTGNLVWSNSVNGGSYSPLMTLTSGGLLGIGTGSVADKLDIAGGVGLTTTTATVPTNGIYSPSANNVALTTNGSAAITVNASQQVGIGTSSVPSGEAASINGSVQVAGTGSETCDTAHIGQMRFNPTGKYMEVCQ